MFTPERGKCFVTIPQVEKYRQISFEEMMAGFKDLDKFKMYDEHGTITRYMTPTRKMKSTTRFGWFDESLRFFILSNKTLLETEDKHELYNTFSIPKRTRGYRTINAPNDELKIALLALKKILEGFMPCTFHTSAYAYVPRRSTVDAVKKHQAWGGHWFGHFDFHDFFGSTTLDFVMKMLRMIYPFACITSEETWSNLRTALSLGFLDGGLPQGTPLSPIITNIMMIPFDHIVTNALHDFPNRKAQLGRDRFIYTRYADDIHVSCRVEFDIQEIQKFILDTLRSLEAPFSLNTAKTHYNSRAGKNYMLGVCLNKDNKITLGNIKRKHLKAALANFAMDMKNNIPWELEDLQILQGRLSYHMFIDNPGTKAILDTYKEKYGFDVKEKLDNSVKQSA